MSSKSYGLDLQFSILEHPERMSLLGNKSPLRVQFNPVTYLMILEIMGLVFEKNSYS
jgi:hypothetical protein